MPETTTENEQHHTVRMRNVMLVLAGIAIIAGLCHAYCVYLDPAPAAEPAATEPPANAAEL